MKQSGARSAPGNFWGIYDKKAIKTKENEAIRRAKRAGEILGYLGSKTSKTIGKCSNPAREARPEDFRGIWSPKAAKTPNSGTPSNSSLSLN